jgi:hypothetical protein
MPWGRRGWRLALSFCVVSLFAVAQSPNPSPGSTVSQRVADALKAGPPFITRASTILDWPKQPGGDFRVLRSGTNGWTCLPTFPGLPHDEPMCLDAVFFKFFQDALAGKPVRIDRVGISYMYAGGWVPNSPNAPPKPGDYHVGPHIMIVVPDGVGLSAYSTDPTPGGAYINQSCPWKHDAVSRDSHSRMAETIKRSNKRQSWEGRYERGTFGEGVGCSRWSRSLEQLR